MNHTDPAASQPPGERTGHGGWRILFAAGNPIDQKLGVGLLGKQGYEVHVASTGPEAVRISAAQAFDAAIIDWWLPELECVEVLRALRQAEPAGRALRILVMAEADEDLREECRRAGADGMLGSPLCLDEFLHRMSELPRGAQEGGPPRSASDTPPITIRWQEALEAVGGRRELLLELVEMFFEEYPPTLDAIRTAIECGDVKSLQLHAHKLKGCLRYFGHTSAAESAKALEDQARQGQCDGAKTRFDELTAALDRLLPGLRAGPTL